MSDEEARSVLLGVVAMLDIEQGIEVLTTLMGEREDPTISHAWDAFEESSQRPDGTRRLLDEAINLVCKAVKIAAVEGDMSRTEVLGRLTAPLVAGED